MHLFRFDILTGTCTSGPTLIWFKSQYPEYEITATSRSPTTTKRLQDFGVHVVEITGLSDVQKAASEADLVINFADGTNQPHVQAITAGLRERFQSTKIRPIFIHISGSLSTWKSTTIAQSGVASVCFRQFVDRTKLTLANVLGRTLTKRHSERFLLGIQFLTKSVLSTWSLCLRLLVLLVSDTQSAEYRAQMQQVTCGDTSLPLH